VAETPSQLGLERSPDVLQAVLDFTVNRSAAPGDHPFMNRLGGTRPGADCRPALRLRTRTTRHGWTHEPQSHSPSDPLPPGRARSWGKPRTIEEVLG
jgi:hypothetical protein